MDLRNPHCKTNQPQEHFTQLLSRRWDDYQVVVIGAGSREFSGSRCSLWSYTPTLTINYVSFRGISNNKVR